MILRLLFTVGCALLLLALMPLLNKGRVAPEQTILSYRLHPFDTRTFMQKEQMLPEEKIEEMNKSELEIELELPQPNLASTSEKVNLLRVSTPTFSASPFVVSAGKPVQATGVDTSIKPSLPAKITYAMDGSDHLVYGPKPTVPLRARQLGLNGKVFVQFEVNENGMVEMVKIVNSTHQIFEKPVVSAVMKYKFKPYHDDAGKLIRVLLSREFEFEIQ